MIELLTWENAAALAALASLEIVDRSTGSPIALEPAFDPAVTSYRATSTTGRILDVRGWTNQPFLT